MKSNILSLVLFGALLSSVPVGAAPRLAYVVIVSRHGVRSPTWDKARLNRYSAEPWPDWGVPPGNLTVHGRTLIRLMGAYYRDWFSAEHLLRPQGCQDAAHVYIHADRDQRTLETGRALGETLLPGCGIAVHTQTEGQSDPLFSGAGTPDPELARAAIRERLGATPQKLIAEHRTALEVLQSILRGPATTAQEIGISQNDRSVELTGPFATSSTFSENLLLEYADGMQGKALGWGRLTREDLQHVMELHAIYTDLMRRTPYLARVRGSNLLSHVLRSLEQAADDKTTAGALGKPGDSLLVLAGHDTNLSNLSGMLGLSWKLPGYQPDDTPPGGALVFCLYRNSESGSLSVKLRYLAQTLDQMRNATVLSLTSPPEVQDVTIRGCEEQERDEGCPWETARSLLQKAFDPHFTSMESN